MPIEDAKEFICPKNAPFLPVAEDQGYPEAEVR